MIKIHEIRVEPDIESTGLREKIMSIRFKDTDNKNYDKFIAKRFNNNSDGLKCIVDMINDNFNLKDNKDGE